jgi:hypothetical protein
MTNIKTILGRDYDRDKNLTYRPQDESGDLPADPVLSLEIPRYQSIISIVLKQHREMREIIFVLKNFDETSKEKQKALLNLASLWTNHAKAEENALYEEVSFSKDIQKLMNAAFKEHEAAQVLLDDLETLNFRLTWNSTIEIKARILAEKIERHLKIEERSYLKMAEGLVAPEDLLRLGHEFARQYKAAAFHDKASLKPSRT